MEFINNCGTEFNMSAAMQCVQELKAWQQSEQQKLCKNPTMNALTNEMEEVLKSFDIPSNVQENYCDDRVSSYSEIDEELLQKFGYQNENISPPVSNLRDNLQILSPNKNFGKSCKVNSINCDKNQVENENKMKCNNINPKKPYLKRGTGLARYGLNLDEIKKKTGKLKFHKPLKSIPSKIKVPRNCLNQVIRFPRPEFVTKPIESKRLDLEKVKVADSWNRYETKDLSDDDESDITKPIESKHLDLEKDKVADSWNRYETKDLSDDDENDSRNDQSELRAFEILEERANKSDFNASSPTVGKLLKKGQHTKCNRKATASGLVRSLNFERINTSTPHQNSNKSDNSYSDSSQECEPFNFPEDVVKNTNVRNNDRQNNHIKTDQAVLTENEKKYLENYTKSSGIMKHINNEQSFDTEILTNRLEDLELEIEKFRAENTKLVKLQREFEIERQKFYKGKEDFMKKLDEEKKREEEKLANERKKLMKEKSLFDKNVKELRNKPNRVEREEIKQLKEQLSELKDDFNKKEARWATGQARLRTQMKLLENSNLALRSELELFRKTSTNKKVTFKSQTERQALRNTKIIHNVNAELSKLTPDNVLTMIDPKARTIPASILRKGVSTSTDNYESSEEISSDDNHFYTDDNDNEDNVEETNTTNNTERNSSDVIRETVLDDGRKEILYSNGNLKKISADGLNTKVIYYNGDVKETKEDSERYYFAKNKTYHSTYKNGLEIIEFPNGQTEKHYKDGKVEIEYVDGKKHSVYPDRKEVWNYLDGSVLTVSPNGHRELVLLNGQREIHTNEFKKRVYPDGTSKIVYPDGSHETKYPDGRIRKKDKDGNLTLDTSIRS